MQHNHKMFKGEWVSKNHPSYVYTSINDSFMSVGYFGKNEINFPFFFRDYEDLTETQKRKRFTDYLKFLRTLAKTLKTVSDLSKTSGDSIYHKDINVGNEPCVITYINSPRFYLRKLTIKHFVGADIPAFNGPELRLCLSKLITHINLLITESTKFMLDQENYTGEVNNLIELCKVKNGFKYLLAPKTSILTELNIDRPANQLSEQFGLKHVVFHSDIVSLEDLNRTKEKYTRLIDRLKSYKSKMENKEVPFEDLAFIGDFNTTNREGSLIACRVTEHRVTLTLGDCYRRVEFGNSNFMDLELVTKITGRLIFGLTTHLNDVLNRAKELNLPESNKVTNV